ncbi:histone demethylase JARID1 [Apiospora arundinis]
MATDREPLSLEERLLSGHDDVLNPHSDISKAKALEILGRTENGRRKAEEIFGPDVWSAEGLRRGSGSIGRGVTQAADEEDNKDVDRIMLDFTNADDDEGEAAKRAAISAESFEAERDDMAMMDSD